MVLMTARGPALSISAMTRATVPVLASAGTSATASAAVLSALNFSVRARAPSRTTTELTAM